MTPSNPVFHGTSLKNLLAEARDFVVKNGAQQPSSRGRTFTIGSITLVWEQPAITPDCYFSWNESASNFYQSTFVDDLPENLPERLAKPGDLLFPYRYAARSRFWDGGWGSVLAVVRATFEMDVDCNRLSTNKESFEEYLKLAGERVHLQTLLAVWDWIGVSGMLNYLKKYWSLETFIKRARVDQLTRIIHEIAANPASRRAVTASFVYPDLDQRLSPIQGIPPYQFFQLLPGEPEEPLGSFHVHRSLDAGQGVQLDFLHDYHWLAQACREVNRPMGSITVTAGDYHVYQPSETAPSVVNVSDWLLAVTDGYRGGQGAPANLLEKEIYRQNIRRIFNSLGE